MEAKFFVLRRNTILSLNGAIQLEEQKTTSRYLRTISSEIDGISFLKVSKSKYNNTLRMRNYLKTGANARNVLDILKTNY